MRLALALAAALSAAPAAATNLITFEEPVVVAMSNVPGAAVPLTARLHDQFRATLGASFSSGAGYVAVVSHAPYPTASVPNIIGGTTPGGTLAYASLITVDFFDPAHPASSGKTGFVRVQGDYFGAGYGSIFLSAYDRAGHLLGTSTDTDNKPYGTGPVVMLALPGISRVTFGGDTGSVGFDNFEFGTVGGVPEPAAWSLMIGGFGLIGAALRRRVRTVQGATACA